MARRTFRRDRSDRVVGALGGRPVAGADRAEPGRGPQDGAEVSGAGGRGGMRAGWRPVGEQVEWRGVGAGWFPELADTRLRQVTWPQIEAHRDYIAGAAEGRGDGGDDRAAAARRARPGGVGGVVAAVGRRRICPSEARRAKVTVLRGRRWSRAARRRSTTAGSACGPIRRTGERRAVWAFVMVLACSRHLFVRPVMRMDQRLGAQAHVEAFAFFGGVPARLVPDNLATGVERPDLYDPKINRAYAELAAHYGVLVDPARAFKPKDKPRVERPMPYVRDSFWRGRDLRPSARAHAGGRGGLVPTRSPGNARTGRLDGAHAGCGVRRRRARGAETVAPQRVRAGDVVDRARSARTSTSRSARRCTRCRGG